MRLPQGLNGWMITALILSLGLAGAISYLYVRQEDSINDLAQRIDEQDQALRDTSNALNELTRTVTRQNEALDGQSQDILSIRNDAAAFRSAVTQAQEQRQTEIAALETSLSDIRKNSAQRLDAFVTSSAKIETTLNDLNAQIKKLKDTIPPPSPVPVIDVKLEQAQPAKNDGTQPVAATKQTQPPTR